jgi:hypothetical protein
MKIKEFDTAFLRGARPSCLLRASFFFYCRLSLFKRMSRVKENNVRGAVARSKAKIYGLFIRAIEIMMLVVCTCVY